MSKLVVFLQNAWSTMDRALCLKALRRSVTGKRLSKVIGVDWSNIHVDNTTKAIGKSASSQFPSDDVHISSIISEQTPQVILTCGTQARDVVSRLWSGKLLAIPHPASRTLTNALLDEAAKLLTPLTFHRHMLVQYRGSTSLEIIKDA